MYGLESAHLTEPWQRKLDAFQLKGLRQILRMPTTFVDRSYTNEVVYARATQARGIQLVAFSAWQERCANLWASQILCLTNSNPARDCTYIANSARPHHNVLRRVGRPRHKWAERIHHKKWGSYVKGIRMASVAS